MPDTKISGLAALATPDVADLFVVVDVSDASMAASGTDKKMTLATLDSRYMPIAQRIAKGWLAAASWAANAVTSGTTQLFFVTTPTFVMEANRRTRITLSFVAISSVNVDTFQIKIHNTAGTAIWTSQIQTVSPGNYMPVTYTLVVYDTPAASGVATYGASITRTVGTGTMTLLGTAAFGNAITVEDVGPNP